MAKAFSTPRNGFALRAAPSFDIKRRKIFAVIVALMVLGTVAGGAWIGIRVAGEIRRIDSNWDAYNFQNATKGFVLSQIRRQSGFGGFIHSIKDLVLKRDPSLIGIVERDIDELRSALSNYELIGTTAKEKKALRRFRSVITEYERTLEKVKRAIRNGTAMDFSSMIERVDNAPAYAALATLETIWLEARDKETRNLANTVSQGRAFLKGSFIFLPILVIVTGMLFWFLRFLIRDITERTHAVDVVQHDRDNLERRVGERTRDLAAEIAQHKQTMDALRRAKDEAERANHVKTTFLANVSHELRTPLNAIIGYSEVINNRLFGAIENERYAEYTKTIHASGQRLLGLINDILDLSLIETGDLELHEEKIDLASLLREAIGAMTPLFKKENVTLDAPCYDSFPKIFGDKRRLNQIFLSLLNYAVTCVRRNGGVRVEGAREADGAFLLSVSDTGAGMSSQDVSNALTPFGKTDSAITDKRDGSGVALPLCKVLIERQGGSLDITCDPQTGATITIRFPTERVIVEKF